MSDTRSIITLHVPLRPVEAALDRGATVAVRTAHAVWPAELADGLVAFRLADQVLDGNDRGLHRCSLPQDPGTHIEFVMFSHRNTRDDRGVAFGFFERAKTVTCLGVFYPI